jgi:hypothetical protein
MITVITSANDDPNDGPNDGPRVPAALRATFATVEPMPAPVILVIAAGYGLAAGDTSPRCAALFDR